MAEAGKLSREVQGKFLDHLAGTCNVRGAARAAGMHPTSIYALRRRDPGFAEEWQEALQAGYDLLETALVGLALEGSGESEIEDGVGRVDVDLALKLMAVHRNAMKGKPHKGGTPLKRMTSEETDREILQRLEMIARSRKQRRKC